MRKPKVLLFDLGGVIVPWVGIIELSRLTGLSEADIIAKGFNSETAQAYEVGDCTTELFLEELNQSLNLGFEPSHLKTLWNGWVQPPYKNTRNVLLGLKADYKIACLSNTNESHWEYLKSIHHILDVFDHAFASHIIKAAKPDPRAWQICLEQMEAEPQDVWFFDDTLGNVKAAQALGIDSYHIDRNVGVIPTLSDLHLL